MQISQTHVLFKAQNKENVRKLQTKEMYLKKESDHVEFNGSIASQKVVTGPCSPLQYPLRSEQHSVNFWELKKT